MSDVEVQYNLTPKCCGDVYIEGIDLVLEVAEVVCSKCRKSSLVKINFEAFNVPEKVI